MYRTHTLKEYNEVIRLRNQGLGPTKIFSFLYKKGFNISYGAIYDWIHTNKRPFQDKILNKISQQSKFLTVEKAYILGVLCGDGYISTNNRVGLKVCDEDFADEFRRCLREVYDLSPSKKFRIIKPTNFSTNPKPQYVISLTSKLVVNDLLEYSKSFKTKEWEIPKEILKSDLKVKSAFLRGLFDSEGTACLKKPGGVYLSICSSNKLSLSKVKEILKKDFNIDLSVVHYESIMKLKSVGYKNVKNFYNYINFTIKRKRDKLKIGLLTYTREGIRKYSFDFKRNTLFLLNKYKDHYFVGGLLGISPTLVYDWEKANFDGRLDAPARNRT